MPCPGTNPILGVHSMKLNGPTKLDLASARQLGDLILHINKELCSNLKLMALSSNGPDLS